MKYFIPEVFSYIISIKIKKIAPKTINNLNAPASALLLSPKNPPYTGLKVTNSVKYFRQAKVYKQKGIKILESSQKI